MYHRIDVFKIPEKKPKSLKINKFHTLVAVNNFQLFKQRPETPLPLSPSLTMSAVLSVRENWNAHTKLFKYAKLWSYHDGTSDCEANSPWQWVFLAVSQRLSSCRGSQAVGETGVSQLFGGRGDRWIAGPRRVYPFSKDICFCALQFRWASAKHLFMRY